MIVMNDEQLFSRAKLLRSHGMTSMSYERAKGHSTAYDVIELGYNYRMDDIHAAIGLVQLGKLKSDLHKRALIRAQYLKELNGIGNILIPFAGYSEFCSNYIFTIVLQNSDAVKREMVRSRLADAGIQTSVHYPAVHRFSIYKDYSTNLPLTDYISDNLITLPMYWALTDDNIKHIVKELHRALA